MSPGNESPEKSELEEAEREARRLSEQVSSLSHSLRDQWKALRKLLSLMGDLEDAIQRLYQSRRWRYSNPLALIDPKNTAGAGYKHIDKILESYRKWEFSNRQIIEALARSADESSPGSPIAERRGVRSNFRELSSSAGKSGSSLYEAWLEKNSMTPYLREALARTAAAFPYQPCISIVMPVYNVATKWLKAAVDSIRGQIYTNWELCIADDASTDAELLAYLSALSADGRVQLEMRKENGHICAATNSAASLARGEFLVFMDNDDTLAPEALFEIAAALQKQPDIDLLYTDEDKIGEDGRRYDPHFKPDWSPELLLSYNYVNHLCCIRRALFEKIGGLRLGYEGAQDQDLLLRAAPLARRIHHIPKVLYHWRSLPGSTASSADSKRFMHGASTKAVENYLEAIGSPGRPYTPKFARKLGVPINLLDWPDNGPSISIIIPTRNHADLLERCIDSIIKKTTYQNFSITVVDNESDEPVTAAYLKSLARQNVKIVEIGNDGKPFSFARINNLAVKQDNSDLILFLNNDTEVLEPRWLSRMAGYLSLPGVGATGARLLYPGGKLQHGGVTLWMLNGIAPDHSFLNQPADAASYFFQAEVARPCMAVTGACMLTRRAQFLELGGFDEARYPVTMNDVDYCMRLS